MAANHRHCSSHLPPATTMLSFQPRFLSLAVADLQWNQRYYYAELTRRQLSSTDCSVFAGVGWWTIFQVSGLFPRFWSKGGTLHLPLGCVWILRVLKMFAGGSARLSTLADWISGFLVLTRLSALLFRAVVNVARLLKHSIANGFSWPLNHSSPYFLVQFV